MNSATRGQRPDPTHPRHEGEDVVLLVLDGVFGELLFAFLRAAEPHRPGLQLLLPPTDVGQTVTAAEGATHPHDPHDTNRTPHDPDDPTNLPDQIIKTFRLSA